MAEARVLVSKPSAAHLADVRKHAPEIPDDVLMEAYRVYQTDRGVIGIARAIMAERARHTT